LGEQLGVGVSGLGGVGVVGEGIVGVVGGIIFSFRKTPRIGQEVAQAVLTVYEDIKIRRGSCCISCCIVW
jgi:hypothetical protein